MIMFTAKVNQIEQNKVFFSFPTKFNYIQKREYPRIDARIPVLIKKIHAEEDMHAETVNIGGGGMQITVSSKFDLHSVLNTVFSLPNKKEINTQFEILRIAAAKRYQEKTCKFN